jgi:cell shape-determining protein MreC
MNDAMYLEAIVDRLEEENEVLKSQNKQMLEEKAMVEQVKKEAMKEFAEKLFAHLEGYENNEYLINVFNDVGEEYGIEI